MKKFLLPLLIVGLCANDSCFCTTRIGTCSFIPQKKTALFSIDKLKMKINRKWTKRALVASSVIGGGVIAYRFAPVIKSLIKTLATRLGIIKPPVVKSRWEKFGDYVKQYVASPVFFSISGFFALICGGSRVFKTRNPVNNEDQSFADSQISSDIPLYWSDSEQTLVNPENLSEFNDEGRLVNDNSNRMEGDQSFGDSQISSDIPLYRSDSEQALVNPENLSEFNDEEKLVNDKRRKNIYKKTDKVSINSYLNNSNRMEFVFHIIDETFEELPKKSAKNLELAKRVINREINMIEDEPKLKEGLRELFKRLEEAKVSYDSAIKRLSPEEKQVLCSKNVNEAIDILEERDDIVKKHLIDVSKVIDLRKSIIKTERYYEKGMKDLKRLLIG